MNCNVDDIIQIIKNINIVYNKNKELLTDLDAAIGDGDHGINMSKGFNITVEKLEDDFKDCQKVLKFLAMSLISNIGGASGPLYGTLFLKASAEVKGKENIDKEDLINMLNAGIEGVKKIGKATEGEKTMLDVLIPVYKSLKDNQTLEEILKVAKERVEYTKTIIATKGRASYVGERSIGHIDPGAMSSFLLINTICEYVRSE